VAHSCNPRYSGCRDQEILVYGHPDQIVQDTLSGKYPTQERDW
jgi:hypothetical protein